MRRGMRYSYKAAENKRKRRRDIMSVELHSRSVVKTITWRIIAVLVTMIAVYLYNKDVKESLVVSLSANAVKMVLYYIHERFWNRINFGRKKIAPDYQI